MICPRVEIDLRKITHNVEALKNVCDPYHINLVGVTKVFCGMPDIAKALVDGGIQTLADSRIENLKKFKSMPVAKLLLRLPMKSRAKEVVRYADISLNSEITTIQALSQEALAQKKIHKIILMVDLGDLREGILIEDVMHMIEKILYFKGISLMGIGTNLTCYGGVIPSKENLGKLCQLAEEIRQRFHISLKVLSGGNSSSLHLLFKGKLPKKINQLRLGEAIVLGRETAFGEPIKDMYDDGFTFVGEVIECKMKPSVPIGEIGMDAFGKKPVFEDHGIRKRAIVAIGRQDVDLDGIKPMDKDIKIIGASSDHLILDVTDSQHHYKVSDEIRFRLSYGGILRLMTSPYVQKKLV